MSASPPVSKSKRLRLGLAIVIAVTLMVGLWPGVAAPINRIGFAADKQALQFRPPSQAITERHVWSESGEATLEIWFEQDAPKAEGNQEIVAFWQDGRPVVVLGQWPKGLYVHSYRDNPGGFPELDRYLPDEPQTGLSYAAITMTAEGFSLSTRDDTGLLSTPWRGIEVGQDFAARLLLGMSRSSGEAFAGHIHAVFVHGRVLPAGSIAPCADWSW